MNIQDLSAKPVEEKPKEGALSLEELRRLREAVNRVINPPVLNAAGAVDYIYFLNPKYIGFWGISPINQLGRWDGKNA